jgi:hypothetical protein
MDKTKGKVVRSENRNSCNLIHSTIIYDQDLVATYMPQTSGFELRRAAIVLRRRRRRVRRTAGGAAQDEGWIAAWILKGLKLEPLCSKRQTGGPTPLSFSVFHHFVFFLLQHSLFVGAGPVIRKWGWKKGELTAHSE